MSMQLQVTGGAEAELRERLGGPAHCSAMINTADAICHITARHLCYQTMERRLTHDMAHHVRWHQARLLGVGTRRVGVPMHKKQARGWRLQGWARPSHPGGGQAMTFRIGLLTTCVTSPTLILAETICLLKDLSRSRPWLTHF
jgi:hypothetical protein